MEGLLGSWGGGVRAEVSGRGLNFLEVALVWKFPYETFRSKVLRSLLRNPPNF